jgi:hypothetical protein
VHGFRLDGEPEGATGRVGAAEPVEQLAKQPITP